MKKLLTLLLLFSFALAWAGSFTPEPAEKSTVENVFYVDINSDITSVNPVVIPYIYSNSCFSDSLVLIRDLSVLSVYKTSNVYKAYTQKVVKKHNTNTYYRNLSIFYTQKVVKKHNTNTYYRNLSIFYTSKKLINPNFNGYSLILNNTSGGLSRIWG